MHASRKIGIASRMLTASLEARQVETVVRATDSTEIARMSAFDNYANDLDDFMETRDRLSLDHPCSRSLKKRTLVPSPSTALLLLIRSRSRALRAVSIGLRERARATPEPSVTLVLAIAAAANVAKGGE
jgi:hypothetical protein